MDNKKESIKKSTLSVDEKDILKYAKKIEKNAYEDKCFSQKIDDFTNGKLKANEVVKVGTTPYCLRIVGAEAVPLVVLQNVLANSLYSSEQLSNNTKKKHTEEHSIPKEMLKNLPQIVRNPALIVKGNSPGILVLISELKTPKGENVIIPVKLNVNGNKTLVNRVSSIYGKKNIKTYLQSLQAPGKILAINKEKAVRLYEDTGGQFPQSLTVIRFDNSIAYSTQNVKAPTEKLQISKTQNKEENVNYTKLKTLFTFSRKKMNKNARNINENTQKKINKNKNHQKER